MAWVRETKPWLALLGLLLTSNVMANNDVDIKSIPHFEYSSNLKGEPAKAMFPSDSYFNAALEGADFIQSNADIRLHETAYLGALGYSSIDSGNNDWSNMAIASLVAAGIQSFSSNEAKQDNELLVYPTFTDESVGIQASFSF
ncbi:hypothetical protein EK599_14070 [Vibrio sp. T187]|uniref:hypothetical protein n=1 Tax=Vibrio TaxID=662 RepID=UPI0010C9E4E9|nr:MULTISPECIES: hypothetical protein [Vibrio]MBW3696822.1 hypothetical protein [Vibrio sp. T187]